MPNPPLNPLAKRVRDTTKLEEATHVMTDSKEQSPVNPVELEATEQATEQVSEPILPSMVIEPSRTTAQSARDKDQSAMEATATPVLSIQPSDVSNAELYLEQLAAEVTNAPTAPLSSSSAESGSNKSSHTGSHEEEPVTATPLAENDEMVDVTETDTMGSRKRKRVVAADFDQSTQEPDDVQTNKSAKGTGTFGSSEPANIVIDLSDGEDEEKDRRSLKRKLQEKLRDMAALKKEVLLMQQRKQKASSDSEAQKPSVHRKASSTLQERTESSSRSNFDANASANRPIEPKARIPSLQQLTKSSTTNQKSLNANDPLLEVSLKESLRRKHQSKAHKAKTNENAGREAENSSPKPFPEILRQHPHQSTTNENPSELASLTELAPSLTSFINEVAETQHDHIAKEMPIAQTNVPSEITEISYSNGPYLSRLVQYYQQMSELEAYQRMIETHMVEKRSAMKYLEKGLERLNRAYQEEADAKADIEYYQNSVHTSNTAVQTITEQFTGHVNQLKPFIRALLEDKQAVMGDFQLA